MTPPKVPAGKLLSTPSVRQSRSGGEGIGGGLSSEGDSTPYQPSSTTNLKVANNQNNRDKVGPSRIAAPAISSATPAIKSPNKGGVPPLHGTPRRGQSAPLAQPVQTQREDTGFGLVSMEYWEKALRDALLSIDELLQQLLALYQRYPREFLGAALFTGILIFIWPSSPDDEYIPSGISMRGLRQRFAFTQSDRIEKKERDDDSLDLYDINALLHRFERRTRVVNVAAYQHGPRSIRTVRIPGSRDQTAIERDLPAPIIRKLNYGDREALTAHVLRVISRHGKRGIDRRSLASAIVSESIRQNYDPLFVAAVIKSESAFNTYARSYVGAQGLMQIMPATARYVESINEIPRGNLSDPGHNLHLGVKYLKYLEEMYKGNRILTLMAYNWGPGHVDRTIKAGSRRGVPREVVNYALRILGDHAQWVDEVNKQRTRSKAT
jgi:hypothetical protein